MIIWDKTDRPDRHRGPQQDLGFHDISNGWSMGDFGKAIRD